MQVQVQVQVQVIILTCVKVIFTIDVPVPCSLHSKGASRVHGQVTPPRRGETIIQTPPCQTSLQNQEVMMSEITVVLPGDEEPCQTECWVAHDHSLLAVLLSSPAKGMLA